MMMGYWMLLLLVGFVASMAILERSSWPPSGLMRRLRRRTRVYCPEHTCWCEVTVEGSQAPEARPQMNVEVVRCPLLLEPTRIHCSEACVRGVREAARPG